MQIVIKIPDSLYEKIQNLTFDELDGTDACMFIRNGTPLSKGHGRLGDLDALREEVSSWGMNDYEPSDFIDVIDQADTIIEADVAERR